MTEKNFSVLIRADGNPEIATGHLMRCLSIGETLREMGAAVEFVVADEVSAELLASFFSGEAWTVHVLHTDYRKPETELPLIKELCSAKDGKKILLVDSYFVTAPYLEALRKTVPTAYLDDLRAFPYPADCIINYDAAPPRDCYRLANKLLLGFSYTPLRKQFRKLCPIFRPQVKNVLLSTGGTDDAGVAGRLLHRLCGQPECREWNYHVLAGPMHVHREELAQMARDNPRIHLYERVEQMAALMQRCDLAVSAAGTTLYELCAAGLPAVSFTMSDNQLSVASDLLKYASLPCAGDVRSNPRIISDITGLLLGLSGDEPARKALAERMHSQIDGKGAERIAEGLLELAYLK